MSYFGHTLVWEKVGEQKQLITVFTKPKPPKATSWRSEPANDAQRLCDGGVKQLKSYDTNTYTYNANGIRTSKTVNGVTHTYTLDGTKILKETWGENTLIPLYDNEDSVCGIIYNDYAYYFLKNLQGEQTKND